MQVVCSALLLFLVCYSNCVIIRSSKDSVQELGITLGASGRRGIRVFDLLASRAV